MSYNTSIYLVHAYNQFLTNYTCVAILDLITFQKEFMTKLKTNIVTQH